MTTQTPATFCIWLQGFLEGCGTSLNPGQLTTLKAKLDTVFTHPEPGPDHAILTERPEVDPTTDIGRQLPDEILKKLWEHQKWTYEGPPIPGRYPHYQPEGPGRLWPPAINC